MINRGAIFCHVVNTIQLVHLMPFITCGSQKWKGAAPIFTIMAKISVGRIMLEERIENGWNIIENEERRINEDPKAWVRKYLMAASVS